MLDEPNSPADFAETLLAAPLLSPDLGAPHQSADSISELRLLAKRLILLADEIERSAPDAPPPVDEPAIFPTPDSSAELHDDCQHVSLAEALYRARAPRDESALPQGLFADPAGDILLDLFIQRHRRRPVSKLSACIASRVPGTTALRWLGVLQKLELITINQSEVDRRYRFVTLTEKGLAEVREMLAYTKMQLDALPEPLRRA